MKYSLSWIRGETICRYCIVLECIVIHCHIATCDWIFIKDILSTYMRIRSRKVWPYQSYKVEEHNSGYQKSSHFYSANDWIPTTLRQQTLQYIYHNILQSAIYWYFLKPYCIVLQYRILLNICGEKCCCFASLPSIPEKTFAVTSFYKIS